MRECKLDEFPSSLSASRKCCKCLYLVARLGDGRLDLAGAPVDVVREAFNEEASAARPIRLIDKLGKVGLLGVCGSLDVPLDNVLGHAEILGLLDQRVQLGIRDGVGAPGLDAAMQEA